MKLKPKVVLVAVLAAVTLAGVIYVDGRYRDARYAENVARFQLLGTLRRSSLQTYFNTATAEIKFWSLSERIHASFRELQTGWGSLGDDPEAVVQRLYIEDNPPGAEGRGALEDAGDGSGYSAAHSGLHAFARDFVTERGYYDFFLIDLDGNIIYTVEKELDFGTSLLSGPYSESGLGTVFRELAADDRDGDVVFSDLARYAPSNDAPAMFAGRVMRDTSGEKLGVLALQLPTDTIAEIMRFTTGMGESGETYLVGRDLLMRSDSRFSDISTILETTVDTKTVHRALAGERGVDLTPDYRGVMVLSAYDHIEISGVRWAVMAEIDAEEVEKSVGNIQSAVAVAAVALFSMVLVTIQMFGQAVLPEPGPLESDTDIDFDPGQ